MNCNPIHQSVLISTIILGITWGCDHHNIDDPLKNNSSLTLENQTHAIQGGAVDNDRTNVVGLVVQQGWNGGACSGVLIAPNLILTAQHCVASTPANGILCGRSRFGIPYSPSDIFVTSETEFPRFGYYNVREVLVPEIQSEVCGNDIALLILNQNIAPSVARPLTPRLDEPVEAGERFTAAGYGHTGDGSGAGVRRSIDNRQVICSGYLNGCQDGNEGIYDNEWVGDNGTCQGDSGGPAIDNRDQVSGILSRGAEGCVYPVYTGVVKWGSWIREGARRAAVWGQYDVPTWVDGVAGVPPPDNDGDGVANQYDNCDDTSNPSQQDLDFDGVGDLCDPLVSMDRGGRCTICDACTQDSDCADDGGVCLQLQTGNICTYPCLGTFECPNTSECVLVSFDERFCLNENIEEDGLCPAEYLCDGPRAINPPPADDGSCQVCTPCSTGLECASGVCATFDSGSVCSRTCEQTSDCRDGSSCLEQNGRKLCVNVDYEQVGICPDDYVCGMSEMSMGGVDHMTAGAQGGEMGGVGEGEAGQTNGGMSSNAGASVSTEILEEDGELALIEEPTKDGCQMMTTPTQQTTQPSQTLSFLLITLSLLCLFSNHKRRLLSDLS